MTTVSAFKIKLFSGGSPTEFQDYYVSKTLEIEENRGFERGTARFRIADYGLNNTVLPYVPIIGQRIEIWNASEDTLFFVGRIAEAERTLIVQRCNQTEATFFDIVCTDLKIDFERILVSERYEGQTIGFIIRDVVRRFTFYSEVGILPDQGIILPDYRVSFQYPSQIIQQLLDIQADWTVWFDWLNEIVYAGEVDALDNLILSVNDATVYDYFDADKLTLSFDESVIKTSAIFIYNQRYSEGTVYVRQGSNVVFGSVDPPDPVATQFTQFVKPNAQIRIGNSESVYTIQEVRNDFTLVLSSPFQEEDILVSSQEPYEITGTRSALKIEDQDAIDRLSLINDETGNLAGKYEFLVPTDSNAYTREEAELIARSHLKRYTEPLITGSGESDNVKIPNQELHAGQAIDFNLPNGKNIQAITIIQQIVKRDDGAIICRSEYPPFNPLETRIDPLFRYSFNFRDRIFETRNQIKRLMADVRRGFASDDIDVESIFTINERFIFTDDGEAEEVIGNKYATFAYGESQYGATP